MHYADLVLSIVGSV